MPIDVDANVGGGVKLSGSGNANDVDVASDDEGVAGGGAAAGSERCAGAEVVAAEGGGKAGNGRGRDFGTGAGRCATNERKKVKPFSVQTIRNQS